MLASTENIDAKNTTTTTLNGSNNNHSTKVESPLSDFGPLGSDNNSNGVGTNAGEDFTSLPTPKASDVRLEQAARRKIVGACISASMRAGRLLARIGLTRGEHVTVRRLSRWGVGVGRSEMIEGVRYLKTSFGGVKCRVYLPETSQPLVNQPVCIYLHGGGWVISSARTYHRFTALFARDTQMVVISVDYRLAPEHPFPAGLDDCLSVTRSILNSDFDKSLFFPHSIDVKRVVLSGDSAGGNLACATALDLIRAEDYRLYSLLLVCPALQAVTLSFPSYREWGPRQPIGYEWFVPRYAGVKHPTRRLMKAFWAGTHLDKDDRVTLSRTVTIGSFATSPTSPVSSTNLMMPSVCSDQFFSPDSVDDFFDRSAEEACYDAILTASNSSEKMAASPVDGDDVAKKFYFEDGANENDDGVEDVGNGGDNSALEMVNVSTRVMSRSDSDVLNNSVTGSGGSSAVSPIGDNANDEELSPFVVKAVTDLAKNKRAWPLLADDSEIKHLPPTFIQICECDPLRSENDIFAERMRRAGAVWVEACLLERAGHIESLLAERLTTKIALKGYQQLVDFVQSTKSPQFGHAKFSSSEQPVSKATNNGDTTATTTDTNIIQMPAIFDQVTEYF